MQPPTCQGIRVRSIADAHIIFFAVLQGILPMVTRRLDSEERRAIRSGSVYVWEERGASSEATGLGIERWTDGIRWGPSRVRDVFLFYQERESDYESDPNAFPHGPAAHPFVSRRLVKQTYSVYLDSPQGRRKWHLIAYFTQESIDGLRTIEDIPALACLCVPQGAFHPARTVRGNRPANLDSCTPSPPRGSYTPPRGAPYPPSSPRLLSPPPAPIQPPLWPSVKYEPSLAGPASTGGSKFFVTAKGVEIPPLAFIENTHIPKRTAVDEYALRSFSIGLGLGLDRPTSFIAST